VGYPFRAPQAAANRAPTARPVLAIAMSSIAFGKQDRWIALLYGMSLWQVAVLRVYLLGCWDTAWVDLSIAWVDSRIARADRNIVRADLDIAWADSSIARVGWDIA